MRVCVFMIVCGIVSSLKCLCVCVCWCVTVLTFVSVGVCVCVCAASSSYQWYSWGPPNMQCRLCASCWTYWKKYGGLKMPTRLDGERPGPNRNNMVHTQTHTHTCVGTPLTYIHSPLTLKFSHTVKPHA